jgi:hypothetical protein
MTIQQDPPPKGGGCLTVILVLAGVVLLLPGACGLIMVVAFPRDVFTDFGATLLVAFLLLLGAGGILLILGAPKIAAPRPPPGQNRNLPPGT